MYIECFMLKMFYILLKWPHVAKQCYWNQKWYKIIKIRNFSQIRESLLWDEISENLISHYHYYLMYNASIIVIDTRITCLKIKSKNMQNKEND